ncbi:glycerophosphoryl diester phosphodiesterase [Flavobacterium micromati]|jgi:glycerophosphoryl diester phosphodiesterase|uniref:Glycerophosphoryl diester phosphodiesterase n=1 Tax=Flavobacterium micromati TaxID=229205 RepID=A0A1M5FNR0_9FLAO|nr:glycerophosphodiester phosphodiesterase family protein [Flavobacterium micromati]MCL6461641.1 glycerophosphodiester phosphodiesterase [Flavobacterium micromati]SHF92791.1 glycerophosphoryl diester phosphodiesterase [Flavobacterium micromati]
MLKIGHRGAKGYEIENTVISFQKAVDMHVDGIELDVHLSSDNEVVVFHDDTVDRLTDGKGLINAFTVPELKRLLINRKEKIPTLREVLELINRKCFINIELKSYGVTETVINLIEEFVKNKNWKYDDFLVSSFDWNALQQVAFLNDKIPIGVLTETNLELALAFAKFIQAKSLHPHFHLLTKENTAQIQSKGLHVFPWTVNEKKDIEKIKSYNVNGIITDFPDRV